jgi:zinc D-Ala-D-Ala dipeptidase
MARWGWVLVLLLVTAGCTTPSTVDDPASVAPASVAPASAGGPRLSAASVPTRPAANWSAAPRTTAVRSPAARPSVSLSALRAVAQVPPVSANARAVGLIDIRTVVPDAVIDLRYATSNNFVGVRMYPVGARCLVHKSMEPGLKVAADRLRRQGLVMVLWDCYRPHAVQVRMFQIVGDPDWVARPGPSATSHEAGRSVDITLAWAGTGRECRAGQRVQGHCLLDMGTGFDDFTARAHAFATSGVSSVARSNRARLRSAMNAGGITVYSGEWWHFNGPGSGVRRPHLNASLS